MQVMADAVARLGEVHAVLGGKRLQENVVIGVLVVELDNVVVYVLDGEGDLNPIYTHLLQLQTGHRAGSVLEQGLIYSQRHLFARLVRAALDVILEDLGDQVVGQSASPLLVSLIYDADTLFSHKGAPTVRCSGRFWRKEEISGDTSTLPG
jgi:hypothetical protein